ncbi:glucose 1-dehydrogenase [Brevundimonas vesicularis]|uniref:glucose 1-dehydrogenase n=1 Tax=Brevundimonas vesicularis TaxID=41276 RepID=UPI0018EAB224|nr:glucose 1-dehydrogenase [Brevundimonas vesicularis]MDQ1193863.1 glucose 1-dehydrogenase [Brevundimonas vesicularis]
MNQKPLAGQRAVVTGASSGIGKAIALAFAEAGAAVVVNHHSNTEAGKAVTAEILEKEGRAVSVRGDVSKPRDVQKLFDAADAHFGGVDILVANAGAQADAPFLEITLEDWRKVIDLDLTGAFLCAQEAAKRFRRQGLEPSRSRALGKVVFVTSVHQRIPWAGHANYAAAKGGVRMLMETMAQELAGQKIRVNAIAPGAIKTPINKAAWDTPAAARKLVRLIPYGRIGEVEDIAQSAVWLASDAADYVVGTTLFVDGGMSLYPDFREGG